MGIESKLNALVARASRRVVRRRLCGRNGIEKKIRAAPVREHSINERSPTTLVRRES